MRTLNTLLARRRHGPEDAERSVWRQRFTDEEWALIRHLPVDVYLVAATADGDLDHEEGEAFVGFRAVVGDPLHRALLDDITGGTLKSELDFQIEESGATEGAARISGNALPRLAATKTLLRDSLTHEEYHSFLASLWVSGQLVATATGPAKGGRHENVSDAEKQALIGFADYFEIEHGHIAREIQRVRDP